MATCGSITADSKRNLKHLQKRLSFPPCCKSWLNMLLNVGKGTMEVDAMWTMWAWCQVASQVFRINTNTTKCYTSAADAVKIGNGKWRQDTTISQQRYTTTSVSSSSYQLLGENVWGKTELTEKTQKWLTLIWVV